MAALKVGVLGLGSVFQGPYSSLITKLQHEGRIELVAGYDPDPAKRATTAERFGADTSFTDGQELIDRADLDIVLVLTSMNEHGSLARAALEAGKHVLVEKPMATSLEEAAELLDAAAGARGQLVCAPHVALSPTYREMHRRVRDGEIGELHLARARYGWSGPWWGRWFYEQGGGSLFDLGVYNLTSLCGFLGSVRRVTAMVGVAVPKREAEGEQVTVRSDDNAHIVLDFGDARFASIATGFTLQKYRSPAVELYGSAGTMQMLGDDWAPEGFEQWTNARGSWEIVGESDPNWPWTDGLRHLVDSVENGTRTLTRPEHAYHALEVMLAAKRSAEEGRVVEIRSTFPDFAYDGAEQAVRDGRGKHDPRLS
ncbi:Gfo/Idh/MocA family oxidoreductase [Streptomyces sp. NBC_01474]|uniref:Gfo/Idh/MocA family protein n=1 Tax=unclassified Streptomyces TaxID=2593676 RepID=UPI002DDC6304|nr:MULTISPECIES: Gfo/Idh/MocA family oxidoreductase [unclassified Streptomyces]WSE00493.1 Gfo/Idh/MocA family oxidoreductase [Streptomyces sp. NBC_01474]